jgi:hypothetical protein
MPIDDKHNFPDLSGYSLSYIEGPGVDYTCLVFGSSSADRSIYTEKYLYLYGYEICEANFTCNPFFPRTKGVNLFREDETGRFTVEIEFAAGNLKIASRDFSVHTKSSPVERRLSN